MKKFILISAFSFFLSQLHSQQSSFQKNYLLNGYSDARGIIESDDGALVITGLDKTGDDSLGNMYAIKLTLLGEVVWKRFYGVPKEDGGSSILKCKEGGYFISGHADILAGECDENFVRIDTKGNMLWRATVGDTLDDVAVSSVEDEDGSFYAVGVTENYGSVMSDIMLTKISKDGKILFVKHFGHQYNERGYGITFTADGNIALSGLVSDSTLNFSNIYIVKCTKAGDLLWEKIIANTNGNDVAHKILNNGLDNIIVIGHKYIQGLDVQGEVISLKENGTVNWEKNYGGPGYDGFLNAVLTSDNQVLCVGITKSFGDTAGDAFMARINNTGELLAMNFYGAPFFDAGLSIAQCKDNSYAIAGTSYTALNNYNAYIVKTTPNGSLNINESKNSQNVLVYPNPFSSELYIKTNDAGGNKELFVYDELGKLVMLKKFTDEFITIYKDELSASNFYIYRLLNSTGNVISTGKIFSY